MQVKRGEQAIRFGAIAGLALWTVLAGEALGQVTVPDKTAENARTQQLQDSTASILTSFGMLTDDAGTRALFEMLDQRLRQSSSDPDAWLCFGLRGWLYGSAGNWDKASTDVNEAIRLAEANGCVKFSEGNRFTTVFPSPGVLKDCYFDVLILTLSAKAELLASKNDTNGAAAICESLQQGASGLGGDFCFVCRAGMMLDAVGNAKRAQDCFALALSYWPDQEYAPPMGKERLFNWRQWNAQRCRQSGRQEGEKVLRVLSRYIAALPKISELTTKAEQKAVRDVFALHADYARRVMADYPTAIKDYSSVLEIFPEYSDTRSMRAKLLERTGQIGKARADYEKILDSYPRDSVSMRRLALLLVSYDETLDAKRAQELVERALSISRNVSSGMVLACVKAEQGDFPGANQVLNDVFFAEVGPQGVPMESYEMLIAIRMGKTYRQALALLKNPDGLCAYYTNAVEVVNKDQDWQRRYGLVPYNVAIWRLKQVGRDDLAAAMASEREEASNRP